MDDLVPVVLFAYARPDHLRRTIEGLRNNAVPLIYAFSDGPRTPDKESGVNAVRKILRGVDWCDMRLCERAENFGLGKSILIGVGEVLRNHDSVLVFEDDIVCVPGTYDYLSAALRHYRDNSKIMSVTGWTHPKVIPSVLMERPILMGAPECWLWGTWARVWRMGMEREAMALMRESEANGIDIYRYGADLPEMARVEMEKNIWAVRFLYLHILHRGLCLRPPHNLVDNVRI